MTSSSSQRHSVNHYLGQSQNIYFRREVLTRPARRRHHQRIPSGSSNLIAASDAMLPLDGRALRKVGENHQNQFISSHRKKALQPRRVHNHSQRSRVCSQHASSHLSIKRHPRSAAYAFSATLGERPLHHAPTPAAQHRRRLVHRSERVKAPVLPPKQRSRSIPETLVYRIPNLTT